MVSDSDKVILRGLANKAKEIASMPKQPEKLRLWTACNDLKPERPMFLSLPQHGWGDIKNTWMQLQCQGQMARKFEDQLKRKIIRHEHIPDDFPILDDFKIPLTVKGDSYNDYGVELEVTRSQQKNGAYHIDPVINCDEDFDKLHFRPVEIDYKTSEQEYETAKEVFGDILEVVQLKRTFWRYGLSRVLIHMRGLSQMMLDFYDNAELIHKLMAFLRDDFLNEIDYYERQNAISLNNFGDNVNGSGGLSSVSDLPGNGFDGHIGTKNLICWGESQETTGVSPELFDEFVLQYQLPLLERFGLVDFGCCEPLEDKLDILIKKIPHLRWVAVSPWANRELCAEKINGKYVYVYKPNPSRICSPDPDWATAEEEIRQTIEIVQGAPLHIIMKDTSTFFGQPERITKWARLTGKIVHEMS